MNDSRSPSGANAPWQGTLHRAGSQPRTLPDVGRSVLVRLTAHRLPPRTDGEQARAGRLPQGRGR